MRSPTAMHVMIAKIVATGSTPITAGCADQSLEGPKPLDRGLGDEQASKGA
jgi:hypothetical protein